MDALGLARDWALDPLLVGRWRLLYSSSKTFATNRGLSGYSRDVGGVETTELLMAVQAQVKVLVYEEPLTLEQGSIAALVGGFANADAVRTECTWSEGRLGEMLVEAQRMVVGGRCAAARRACMHL